MSEQRQYFGCRVVQRKNERETIAFFAFYARVKDVRKWCGIKRAKDFPDGTQRILRPSRSRAVTRFFERGSTNTIPSNILLAFEPGLTNFTSFNDGIATCISGFDINNDCDGQIDWGVLKFLVENDQPEHLRPALIVDGQHRLDGMSNFAKENLPVLFVALIDTPPKEQAFHFIVINSKSVRVSTDNAKSIVANLSSDDEKVLEERLIDAGVSYAGKSAILKDINDLDFSPFRNMLDWEYNRTTKSSDKKGLVQLTAVEVGLRYVRDQLDFMNLAEDDDTLIEVFCAIWRAVKGEFLQLWGTHDTFMTKANITALNEFLVDRLKASWADDALGALDADNLERKTRTYLRSLSVEFWISEWSIKIQDNANVRGRIKDDLWTMTSNAKRQNPWNKGLRLPIESD